MRVALASSAVILTMAAGARAERWDDATATTIGTVDDWTNRVELADLDGDGWVDLLFANGTGGEAGAAQRAFRNLGNWTHAGPHFAEISGAVFGPAGARVSRVIRAGDLDGDGDLDLVIGADPPSGSQLFLRAGDGSYAEGAPPPAAAGAIAAIELGDLDGDGELDAVVADAGSGLDGAVRLWLADGAAGFTAAAADRTPAGAIVEPTGVALIDVDDDADLDLLVSSGGGGRLWLNDGAGRFTDGSDRLPAGADRDYQAMDVDGDNDLDLAAVDGGPDHRERLLINDGRGRFDDRSAALLAGAANPAGVSDSAIAFVDVDSDRDADLVIAASSGPDRLLRNDGAGGFTIVDGALPAATRPTLGLALADLDHDGRIDLVEGGETGDVVELAAATNRLDTAVPVVHVLRRATRGDRRLIARIHDRRSPSRLHDWRRVVVEIGGPGTRPAIPMRWIGEYLWTATVPDEPDLIYRVCATDVTGNPFCAHDEALDPVVDAGADGPVDVVEDPPGGCCATGGGAGGSAPPAIALAIVLGLRRRRGRR